MKKESLMRVRRERKYLNNEIESYSNRVYIHNYYSEIGNLPGYTRSDVCVFYAILYKFLHFLYFRATRNCSKSQPTTNPNPKRSFWILA